MKNTCNNSNHKKTKNILNSLSFFYYSKDKEIQ